MTKHIKKALSALIALALIIGLFAAMPQTAAQAAPSQGPVLPPNGSVTVNAVTEYFFTPDRTGLWQFRTSNNGDSDPFLMLFAPGGEGMMDDDDGAGDLNSLIIAMLTAGSTYSIYAGFYDYNAQGSYTLTSSMVTPTPLSASGGTVTVNGTTAYAFTPGTSG